MSKFHRNMLPSLGVQWHYFSNRKDAMDFARWAEKETKHDEYPCDAYVTYDDTADISERYEVKVRNW